MPIKNQKNIEGNKGLLGEDNDLASISTSRELIGLNTGKCFRLSLRAHQQRTFIKFTVFCLIFFFPTVSWTGDSSWQDICKCILSHLGSCSHDTFYRVGLLELRKPMFPVCIIRRREADVSNRYGMLQWSLKGNINIPANSHFNPALKFCLL